MDLVERVCGFIAYVDILDIVWYSARSRSGGRVAAVALSYPNLNPNKLCTCIYKRLYIIGRGRSRFVPAAAALCGVGVGSASTEQCGGIALRARLGGMLGSEVILSPVGVTERCLESTVMLSPVDVIERSAESGGVLTLRHY